MGRAAKILILGTGIFGSLAARMLHARGHEVRAEHRPMVDADDEASVVDAARGMDAVLHTAGPFQKRTDAAARAAASLSIPYVDLSDDREFSEEVRAVASGSPILTGMSTTPALVEALAAIARRRADPASPATAAMFVGGGNPQGPATMAFAAAARAAGPSIRVDFPEIGKRRAYPARAYFHGEYFVAVGGIAGLVWADRTLFRALAPFAHKIPTFSGDTSGAIVAFVGDAREGVYALEDGKRAAILPAVWALEEALAGRAPRRSALPKEWVDPDALVAFFGAHGFKRVSD